MSKNKVKVEELIKLDELIDDREYEINPKGVPNPLNDDKYYELFEVFSSVEGEYPKSGEFVTFVRFPICNYNCSWCDTMKNPNNKPKMFKYSDIKTAVESSGALTFTGGEASLFLTDMVDIIDRLIKDDVYFKYVKVETNGTNLELMDKTFRHFFEKVFGENYESKFILCWSPKLMTRQYFKTAMDTIHVFNPRNMFVKIVIDPKQEKNIKIWMDEFIKYHGLKGKEKFTMMPLSIVKDGNTSGVIDIDSLQLIKELAFEGFSVSLRVHEALIVR